MTTPTLGTAGARMDLLIRQGATFTSGSIAMQNPDGTAVDLTGCLFQGQMRKKRLDSAVSATFTCVVTDAAAGLWKFGLSSTETAALNAGETLADDASNYVYDIEMIDGGGNILPIFYGNVQVQAEVTRG